MVQVGAKAPNFSLTDQNGTQVSLSNYLGRAVVLFFFPKASSAVCTKEACQFQSEILNFEFADATVLGISRDSVESQKRFAESNHLTFSLLSDSSGEVTAKYGVPKFLGILPSRITFVIDRAGVIRATFRNERNAESHVRAAKIALESLDQIS